MAAVVLIRALKAIRHGGGLPLTHTLRIALKMAFMLIFTCNGETLGILFQRQVARLTERLHSETTLGAVRPA